MYKNLYDWTELKEYFLYSIKNQEYENVINFNIKEGIKYLKFLDGRDLMDYCIYVGVSYQEVGKLEKADVFFDFYLYLIKTSPNNNLHNNKNNPENLSIGHRAMIALIYELGLLGMNYKTEK